jgi:Ca2+-binding RTX toxin-like protein
MSRAKSLKRSALRRRTASMLGISAAFSIGALLSASPAHAAALNCSNAAFAAGPGGNTLTITAPDDAANDTVTIGRTAAGDITVGGQSGVTGCVGGGITANVSNTAAIIFTQATDNAETLATTIELTNGTFGTIDWTWGTNFPSAGNDTVTITGSTGNDSIMLGTHPTDTAIGAAVDLNNDGNPDLLNLQTDFPDAADVVTVNGGDGDDTVSGAGFGALTNSFTKDAATPADGGFTVNGDAGNDTLTGGTANDNILGLAGNDILNGAAGIDFVSGGADNDTLNGGTGADGDADCDGAAPELTGGAGNDVINGGEGNDDICGDAGNDTLAGDSGNDFIRGGADNDTVNEGSGSSGADSINADAGNNIIDYSARSNPVTITTSGASNDGESDEQDSVTLGVTDSLLLGSGNASYTNDGNVDQTVAGGCTTAWSTVAPAMML